MTCSITIAQYCRSKSMTLNRLARKMKLSWAKHSQCFYYAPNVIVINLYYLFMGCRVTSSPLPLPRPQPPTPLCRCHFTVLLYCIALNRFASCLNAQSFSFSLALLYPLYFIFPRYLPSRFIYAHFHFITSIYSVHKNDHNF